MSQQIPAKDTPLHTNLNFAPGSYLESTGRPLYALLFLLLPIAIYELGTILVNTDQIAHTQSRVAAFTWLMGLAEWIGVRPGLAWAFPGLVVVIILACWHLSSDHSWQVRPRWLAWMVVECLLLSLPLFALGAVLNSSDSFVGPMTTPAVLTPQLTYGSPYWANFITSLGAGIYEELVFRLILMGLIVMLLEDLLKIKAPIAAFLAVLISATLFAAHHYIGIEAGHIGRLQRELFTLGSFLFRTAAGIYFAFIFRYRGYGIAAGTHTAYNMIYFALADGA